MIVNHYMFEGLKITNSFHVWLKQKSCLCIKWTQTDNASLFVMQVVFIISCGMHCIMQRGVETFNLWPPFFLFSQHTWQFSCFHWLVCRSEPQSQLAVHSVVHYRWNRMPSAQKIATEMGIKEWTFHWVNFQFERWIKWEAFGHALSLTEMPLCCMDWRCCRWWKWTWK